MSDLRREGYRAPAWGAVGVYLVCMGGGGYMRDGGVGEGGGRGEGVKQGVNEESEPVYPAHACACVAQGMWQ